LTLDRIENLRMLISEDQRRVVAGKIEQLVAVYVEQPAAVTFFQDHRIRRMEKRAARIPTGKVLATLQEVLVGGRGQVAITLFLLG
jgi:chromosome condensin MukBEF complex kleisin-like MukF subunit